MDNPEHLSFCPKNYAKSSPESECCCGSEQPSKEKLIAKEVVKELKRQTIVEKEEGK